MTGVTEQAGELVIFAESAVWGVRLRYAVPQLLTVIGVQRANIVGVRIRVVPRAAPAKVGRASVDRRGVRQAVRFHVGNRRVRVFFERHLFPRGAGRQQRAQQLVVQSMP